MKHDLGRCTLKNSSEELEKDIADILAYYDDNEDNDEFLVDRPQDYIAAIKEQKAYFIKSEAGEIISCSFCFTYCEGTCVEVGGTRVIWNGFQLQRLLLSARIVSSYLMAERVNLIWTVNLALRRTV